MPTASCICGECVKCKRNAYMAEWYARNADKVRARVREYRNRNIETIRERDRLRGFRQYDKEKTKARRALHYGLECGRLTRPARCESCAGGSNIQAHHEDYSKPLEVRWLCASCHGRVHRKIA